MRGRQHLLAGRRHERESFVVDRGVDLELERGDLVERLGRADRGGGEDQTGPRIDLDAVAVRSQPERVELEAGRAVRGFIDARSAGREEAFAPDARPSALGLEVQRAQDRRGREQERELRADPAANARVQLVAHRPAPRFPTSTTARRC
jgi:hypothetical protein